MTAHHRDHQRTHRDAGRASVFVAILAPALLAAIGLIIDGHSQVQALQRADNIAAEAARAAGQAIEPGQAIAGGSKQLDATLAIKAAQTYLDGLDGVTGTVHIADDRQQLTITVHIAYHPILIDRFGGPGDSTVSGHATATLVAR